MSSSQFCLSIGKLRKFIGHDAVTVNLKIRKQTVQCIIENNLIIQITLRSWWLYHHVQLSRTHSSLWRNGSGILSRLQKMCLEPKFAFQIHVPVKGFLAWAFYRTKVAYLSRIVGSKSPLCIPLKEGMISLLNFWELFVKLTISMSDKSRSEIT